MISKRPVVANCDFVEAELAKNQPQYQTLHVAVPVSKKGKAEAFASSPYVARFSPTPEERKLIAEGADIYLVQSTFGDKFRPVGLTVVPDGGSLDCGDFE